MIALALPEATTDLAIGKNHERLHLDAGRNWGAVRPVGRIKGRAVFLN